MVAGKNYNIQTKTVVPLNTTGKPVAVGSSVAPSKTRYVTFIAISPNVGGAAKSRNIYFCSTTASSIASTDALASANAKWRYTQMSATAAGFFEPNTQFPAQIDTENPLFTIAASKWLTVHQTSAVGSAASVFVQYYEQ